MLLLLFWNFGEAPPVPDSDAIYVTVVSGLSHLEGQEVVAWSMGIDLRAYTVSGGSIAIRSSAPVTSCIVGLWYEARYKSAKQAFAAAMGTPLNQRKRIDHVGLIMADTHYQGLQYGPDFDTMDDLPLVESHEETAANTVWESYDRDMIEFPGEWSTDSRVCLKAAAPRPVTLMALTVSMLTNEKT